MLTGILAGAMADNNRIGYIADYPIAGSVASINAFAFGAQMANHRAKVYLKWSSVEGSHPLKELIGEGIMVCSGQDMITPGKGHKKFGLYTIGEETRTLATAVTDWGKLYEKLLNAILSGSNLKDGGKPKSYNYWFGMDAGVVDVICSTKLQQGTKRLIDMVRHGITHGHFHMFEGELFAQDGICIQKEGLMSPENIVSMDWLAENVVGEIPKLSELKNEAKAVSILQSIDKTKRE